jgi:mannose-1-phosphate guanylyltransferase
MATSSEVFAVIMAGGSGTRFWPASRQLRPKQFLPISGGRAMIAETWDRLEGLVPSERILVVTAESQIDLVREALPEIPHENVLPEPSARNTAPCIAFAAHEIARRNPDSVQVVLPSDHVIRPREAFLRTLANAVDEAENAEVLVIFGVRPDHPATGYGYIEAGRKLHERGDIPVLSVARFVEKPDRARAEEYLASGRYLWNSGMFVWRTSAIQAALRAHVPAIALGFDRLDAGAELEEVYAELPSVPIDTAVLERASNIRMLPIEYLWSDVGSWAAIPETREPDAGANYAALSGGASLVAEDAHDCIVYAEKDELVALLGVRDLVVVRAGDATLVCPRDRAQDVRLIVERLKREGRRFL